MKFFGPPAHQAGSSDLHQGSIPSCATSSGFLNLLTFYSASSRPNLVSCWWHSWTLGFQRFSPVRSEQRLSAPLVLLAVLPVPRRFRSAAPRICASTRSVRRSEVLPPTVNVDPLLASLPSEVDLSASSPCFQGDSSHGLLRDHSGKPS